MPKTTDTLLHKFEARIYEKAKHWEFDAFVKAGCEEQALVELRKLYPRKQYAIGTIYRAW